MNGPKIGLKFLSFSLMELSSKVRVLLIFNHVPANFKVLLVKLRLIYSERQRRGPRIRALWCT